MVKFLSYPVRDASSTLQELIKVLNLRWPPAAKRFNSAELQGHHLLAPEQVMGRLKHWSKFISPIHQTESLKDVQRE